MWMIFQLYYCELPQRKVLLMLIWFDKDVLSLFWLELMCYLIYLRIKSAVIYHTIYIFTVCHHKLYKTFHRYSTLSSHPYSITSSPTTLKISLTRNICCLIIQCLASAMIPKGFWVMMRVHYLKFGAIKDTRKRSTFHRLYGMLVRDTKKILTVLRF